MNTSFTYSAADGLYVAQVAGFDTCKRRTDFQSCLTVKGVEPFQERVVPFWGEILADFIHNDNNT